MPRDHSHLQIGLNFWPYTGTECGGMLYYALSLLREFLQIIPNRLCIFYGEQNKELIQSVPGISAAKTRLISSPGEIFNFKKEFDILFCPATWGGVNMLDCPLVHAIPDIQEQFYPGFFTPTDLKSRHIYHPYSVHVSTLTITISNFSKKSIVERFNIEDNRVKVTHLSAHNIFSDYLVDGKRPEKLPEDIGKFLFYPANAWQHKNHITLLEALCIIKEKIGVEIPTIFTGNLLLGSLNRVDIIGEIQARGLNKTVFHIGEVSLSELKFLYRNALALVHPSLFEGFGIPVVEAMASRCPIIAANSTSLPEIAGEAALYFQPDKASDLAEKIMILVNSPSDVDKRVGYGTERAKKFSDSKTSRQTLDILYEAHEIFNRIADPANQKYSELLQDPINMWSKLSRKFLSRFPITYKIRSWLTISIWRIYYSSPNYMKKLLRRLLRGHLSKSRNGIRRLIELNWLP